MPQGRVPPQGRAPIAHSRETVYSFPVEFEILRQTKENCVYFTVYWSRLTKADKFEIVRSVPAMGGVAEMYYRDDFGKLNVFCITRSWYGGLRSTIRTMCDPIEEKDPGRRKILLEHKGKIFYRYALSESFADMSDVVFFFMENNYPGAEPVEHSGRFSKIFMKEIDADTIVTI
jgi:hypothetical protein